MDKVEFDNLFHAKADEKLGPFGFQLVGKSLVLRDEIRTVNLIRLGGRMSLPGGISHLLGFRHSFLRDMNEQLPSRAPSEVYAYPFKFLPSVLMITPQESWRYCPRNLNYDYDRFEFRGLSPASVEVWLDRLFTLIGEGFLSWVNEMSPEVAAMQITKYGEQAWCERLWLADYANNGYVPAAS